MVVVHGTRGHPRLPSGRELPSLQPAPHRHHEPTRRQTGHNPLIKITFLRQRVQESPPALRSAKMYSQSRALQLQLTPQISLSQNEIKACCNLPTSRTPAETSTGPRGTGRRVSPCAGPTSHTHVKLGGRNSRRRRIAASRNPANLRRMTNDERQTTTTTTMTTTTTTTTTRRRKTTTTTTATTRQQGIRFKPTNYWSTVQKTNTRLNSGQATCIRTQIKADRM